VFTLLGLYVGAYYALVRPALHDPGFGPLAMAPRYPSAIHRHAKPLFNPIHRIDRKVRPKTWALPPIH
jgi:hypothetical protein